MGKEFKHKELPYILLKQPHSIVQNWFPIFVAHIYIFHHLLESNSFDDISCWPTDKTFIKSLKDSLKNLVYSYIYIYIYIYILLYIYIYIYIYTLTLPSFGMMCLNSQLTVHIRS